MKRSTIRTSAGALGGMLLIGVTTAAIADEEQQGDDSDVEVSVEIEEVEEPGVLAMSVDGDAVSLEEEDSEATTREFTGELPDVTVTDTRSSDEIEDGMFWYVLGQASEFEGPENIPAENLGWEPQMITDDDDVFAGERVETALDEDANDNNVGLVDKELLSLAFDSQEAAENGESWTATADLFLKTHNDVEPGNYSSTMTLSLWENDQ